MKKPTALVTGGAGFIGSHMAERLLSLGYSVIVLDNESTGLRANVPTQAKYILGDVTNLADVQRAFSSPIDAVFHIAGQASTIRAFSEPVPDLNTNVLGTINILKACIEHRVHRLLYASSMTAYGHPKVLPVPETLSAQPISYYGITKFAAERYVLATSMRNDLDFQFRVTAFRMFNVYGERQRLDNPYQGVLGFFVGSALNGKPIIIHGDGEQTRDFVYISDVVDAWMAALDCPDAYGQVFNLGIGEAVSIKRLAEAVINACGHNQRTYPIEWGPLRPGDQRHMTADIRHAKNVLGWKPKVSLDQGLERTVAWAKKQVEKINV